MTIMFGILLVTWTLCCTCLAIPDVHKQMTVNQLQSIFHVDNIDSVPHYELIKLLHHGSSSGNYDDNSRSNRRRKRSINNQMNIESKNIHHIKKDLSKTSYFSDIKNLTEQNSVNSISDLSDNNKIKNLDLSYIKEHNVSFSAFGELLNLTLKQTDGLFKNGPQSLRMWMVRTEPNSTQGLEYDEIDENSSKEEDEHIGEVFQDENNMAAILMRRQLQTGDLVMEGSIGHELVIKPLPHELSPNKEEVHHIVYKRSSEARESLSDFAYMEPDRLEKRYREKRSISQFDTSKTKWTERDDDDDLIASSSNINRRSKRAAPYIIYPEILVIVDYDGYRLHGGDNLQVKRYFVSFWNGVDLRYRLLKGPRIRISIAGIIISRGRDATPYLERNRVGRDAIDSAAALTDMGKYLFRERRLPVYDIAVAITKLDMCRRNYPYGECKRGTAGFAYVGGACVVNKRLEKVNSVAIIEDTGGFSGIIVAAHEVGHLLGAVHDGSPPPSYLGGPGAQKCRWEDGYIMSDLRHTERGFRWSACTIQSFHHFLNGDTASCLHNAPHEDSALGRALPGTLLSLDAQCRRDRGTYACFKDDRVCAQLFCFDSQTGYCVAYRPAAEGSSCGNGVHCLDGRCVAAHAATAYTQHVYRQAYNNEDEEENEDDDEEEDEDDEEEDDDDDYNESTPKSLTLDTTPTITNSTTPTTTVTKSLSTSVTTTTTTTTTTSTTSVPTITTTINTTPIIHSTQSTLQVDEKTPPPTTIKITKLLTTKRPSNLNPFYYGISKLKTHLDQQQQHNTNHTTTTTNNLSSNRNRNISNKQLSLKPVIRKPFDYYLNLYNIKYRNSHSSNSPYYSSSTTITTTTTQQTPTIISTTTGGTTTIDKKLNEFDGNYDNINDDNVNNNNDDDDDDEDSDFGLKFNINNNNNNNSPTTQRSYILGGRSTTRTSFFDSYFRKLTTKTPNYDNIGKLFRRINISSSSSSSISTSSSNSNSNNNNNNNNNHSSLQQYQHLPATPSSYSSNYLGDNSNYLPVNVSVTK